MRIKSWMMTGFSQNWLHCSGSWRSIPHCLRPKSMTFEVLMCKTMENQAVGYNNFKKWNLNRPNVQYNIRQLTLKECKLPLMRKYWKCIQIFRLHSDVKIKNKSILPRNNFKFFSHTIISREKWIPSLALHQVHCKLSHFWITISVH